MDYKYFGFVVKTRPPNTYLDMVIKNNNKTILVVYNPSSLYKSGVCTSQFIYYDAIFN